MTLNPVRPATQDRPPRDLMNRVPTQAALPLKTLDQNVRAYEQAQKNAGGRYAGKINYQYISGPGGQNYAVSGHTAIDTSPVPGNPKATIAKMETVQAAALFSGAPSTHDRAVAQTALMLIDRAEKQISSERGAKSEGPDHEGFKRAIDRMAAAQAETAYASFTYSWMGEATSDQRV